MIDKSKRIAKEMRFLVGTLVFAAGIYLINIDAPDSEGTLGFVDAFLITLIPVMLLRVFFIVRNRRRTNFEAGVDSWPSQPGEVTAPPIEGRPHRVTVIEEMIVKSSIDPAYFDSVFAVELRRAFGGGQTTLPTLENGKGVLRKISGVQRIVRRRNIQKINGYLADLRRGRDESK